MRSAPYLGLPATEMLANLHDELKAMGITMKMAEASGARRDSIMKAGLNRCFGKLSPGMSVQKVVDDWSKGDQG